LVIFGLLFNSHVESDQQPIGNPQSIQTNLITL